MSVKNMGVSISEDRIPTKSDLLSSDCLFIECTDKIVIAPNTKVQVNLNIRNTSNTGRVATVFVLFDPSSGIRVQFSETKVYVGPESRTTIFVLLEALMNARGNFNITFGVS